MRIIILFLKLHFLVWNLSRKILLFSLVWRHGGTSKKVSDWRRSLFWVRRWRTEREQFFVGTNKGRKPPFFGWQPLKFSIQTKRETGARDAPKRQNSPENNNNWEIVIVEPTLHSYERSCSFSETTIPHHRSSPIVLFINNRIIIDDNDVFTSISTSIKQYS